MDPLAPAADLAVLTGLAETDPNLVLALKRASGRFRLAARHSVSQVTEEIWLNGTGTAELLLPAAPVSWAAVTLGTSTLAEGSGYQIDRAAGRLYRAAGWPSGVGNVHVNYTHGYDPVPDGVADAVLEHATTLALTYAHIQQEGAGNNTTAYGAAAMIGTTQKWVDAVESVRLRGRT